MHIEPAALISLFETLILHEEKIVIPEPENIAELPPVIKKESKRLVMIFNTEPTADENIFLDKILTAIKVKSDETEKIYAPDTELLNNIITENTSHVLLWGIGLQGLEKYKMTAKDKAKVISSDELGAIASDQNLKAKLWNCLKLEFPA